MLTIIVKRRSTGRVLSHVCRRSLNIIDLSEPHLWYTEARGLKRNIICHVGGTNSGKTYTALSALSAAKTGIYCGPLRLLAWEVQGTLCDKGIKCSLLTGQERTTVDGETHVSCTVEMADLQKRFEVAVIDETQLLGDESRGWAWTQALLGLQADEIHLCGSPSMLPIIKSLCQTTGDNITIKTYSRLTPLTVSAKSLKTFRKIEPGDCVVGFGRRGLYDTKKEIEMLNPGLRCCVIYGGLPPDSRKDQARLFSTPDSGYDVLVASDAIGMGLNLAIKRIIFSQVEKFDGRSNRELTPAEIKQIAGRAGRYGTQYADGVVTCMSPEDLKCVRKGMQIADQPVLKAGLFPSIEQLQLLSVLVNHDVTVDIARGFWAKYIADEFGDDVEIGDNDRMFSNFNTRMIMKSFGTIHNFIRQLELYLQHYRHQSPQGRGNNRSRVGKNKGDRRFAVEEDDIDDFDGATMDSAAYHKRREERNRLHEVRIALLRGEEVSKEDSDALEQVHINNLKFKSEAPTARNRIRSAYEKLVNSKKHTTQVTGTGVGQDSGTLNSTFPQIGVNILSSTSDVKVNRDDATIGKQQGVDVIGDSISDSNVIIEDEDYNVLTSYMDPNTHSARNQLYEKPESTALSVPLSKLLTMFHKNSDVGDSGNYFLCNLGEKILIAKAIDNVPMSFRTRYIFCMAPVTADNRILLAQFQDFASAFSKFGRVPLTNSVYLRKVPINPQELLKIETLHQYFECYLWLSQRFPHEFVHAEKAARESKHCADLVEKALKSFADSAASITRKGKKSVISFDKVFRVNEAVITSSDSIPEIELVHGEDKNLTDQYKALG